MRDLLYTVGVGMFNAPGALKIPTTTTCHVNRTHGIVHFPKSATGPKRCSAGKRTYSQHQTPERKFDSTRVNCVKAGAFGGEGELDTELVRTQSNKLVHTGRDCTSWFFTNAKTDSLMLFKLTITKDGGAVTGILHRRSRKRDPLLEEMKPQRVEL